MDQPVESNQLNKHHFRSAGVLNTCGQQPGVGSAVSNKQPPEASIRAAREFLLEHPVIAEGGDAESLINSLAELHARHGDDHFRLLVGLRLPNGLIEQLFVDEFMGKISKEELRRRLEAEEARDIDLPLLEQLYAETEAHLHRYAAFLRAVIARKTAHDHGQGDWREDEAALRPFVEGLNRKSGLLRSQLERANGVIAEIRLERHLGQVRVKEIQAPTLWFLTEWVTHLAIEGWASDCKIAAASHAGIGYSRSAVAPELFCQVRLPKLPEDMALLSELEAERTAVRVEFRRRAAGPQPVHISASEVKVSTQDCRVDAAAVTVAKKAPADRPADPQPLLAVERWSDLAIGIDEDWKYWALTPAPEIGEPFPKARAVELILPGERWKSLLKLATDSQDGRTISKMALAREFKYLDGESTLVGDSRARPGAVEEGQTVGSGLSTINKALERLRDAVSDLRREVRAVVRGPEEKPPSVLAWSDKLIHTGFTVAVLVADESRHLHFGAPGAG
jgi:hypothetical protein